MSFAQENTKNYSTLLLCYLLTGPTEDIPVKVTGNVKNGFTAEFFPIEVGIHMILVEYNGVAVGGTPYYSKAYDSANVAVSDLPKSAAGKTVTFAGIWEIFHFVLFLSSFCIA